MCGIYSLACALLVLSCNQDSSRMLAMATEEQVEQPSVSVSALRCGVAQRWGRRAQMEDRAICVCPLLQGDQDQEEPICFLGVYDGHEGSRASQWLADELANEVASQLHNAREKSFDDILTALNDSIQATSETFLSDAARLGWEDGSTAATVLIVDGSLVVANIGNSRVVLCKRFYSETGHLETQARTLSADHHPGRQDERMRIESAGGRVEYDRGNWRIDGVLELSRAIGDVPYRDKGLIELAEFSDWYTIGPDYGFLVVASDGVFEKMDEDLVCKYAEDTRTMEGRIADSNQWMMPIPLGGQTAPTNMCRSMEEKEHCLEETHLRSIGSDVRSSLEACCDCHLKSDYHKQNDDDGGPCIAADIPRPLTLEQSVAGRIVSEAYNRGSMDNIATVVLDLSIMQNEAAFPTELEGSPDSGPLCVFDSLDGQSEYCLTEKIAVTPKPLGSQWHVHWDAEAIPEPHHHEDGARATIEGGSLDALPRRRLHESSDASSGIGIIQESISSLIPYPIADECPSGAGALDTSIMCPPVANEGVLALVQTIGSLPLIGEIAGSMVKPVQKKGEPKEETWSFKKVMEVYQDYELNDRFAAGSFGEVWRAVEKNSGDSSPSSETYVLKRIRVENGRHVLYSGLREKHFGQLFAREAQRHKLGPHHTARGHDHLVRFVEALEPVPTKELWLVFRDEGVSLHSMMYEKIRAEDGRKIDSGSSGLSIVKPSRWWRSLRRSRNGDEAMKDFLQQLLEALEVIHAVNVTHRDVKPENILLSPIPEAESGFKFQLRLIDFGSAVDEYTLKHLYWPCGPSDDEQTLEYVPPEGRLGRLRFSKDNLQRLKSYDMWSVGVLWLELILGTPHVFHLNARTRALLDLRLKPRSEAERQKAYLMRGLMEMCIYPPRHHRRCRHDASSQSQRSSEKSDCYGNEMGCSRDEAGLLRQQENDGERPATRQQNGGDTAKMVPGPGSSIPAEEKTSAKGRQCEEQWSLVSWSCSGESLMDLLRSRDPTGRGLPNEDALHLLMSLLDWYPNERPTPTEALASPYFQKKLIKP